MATTKQMLQLTHEEEEEEACMRALQLASGPVLPLTLKVAIELGILEIIVAAIPGTSLSPQEIAARLPTENPQAAAAVDRILRLLAAYNIVGCTIETGADGHRSRKYSMTTICKYFTKNEDGSLASLVLLQLDKVVLEPWYYMKNSILEGEFPEKAAYGMSAYDYHGTDPRFNRVFNEAMCGHSTIMVKHLLRAYAGFDEVKVLVDVGGGIGATLRMITSRHPHIKGINFDLPHVISNAQPLPGVEHVCGDMFVSVPSGDTILLKWILHNWSDEHCAKLMKNCWEALPQKGKVIVVESVLPIVAEPTIKTQVLFQLDLAMLTLFNSKERTEEEYKALAKEAGFLEFNARHVFADTWVMEFSK